MSDFVRRHRWLLFGLAAVVVVAGVWFRLQGGGAEPEAVPPRGHLGPTPGPSVEGHIDSQTAFLAVAAAERPDSLRAGLVSFSRMLTGAEAAVVAQGFNVDAAFVRRPDGTFDATQIETSLEDVVDPGCSCIYAVVIERSTLSELRVLQGHPDVRLVDVPRMNVTDLSGWELTPIVPE